MLDETQQGSEEKGDADARGLDGFTRRGVKSNADDMDKADYRGYFCRESEER